MATSVMRDTQLGDAATITSSKNETLKRLGLVDPREALLCLPDSFADTRICHYVIPEESDEERRLYNFRFTGQLEGIDKDKKVCDLRNTGGWARTFHLKIGLIDSEGNEISWSVFGNPWPYRDLEKDEYLNLVGRVVYFGYTPETTFAVLKEADYPPAHAIGKIWVKYLGVPGRVAGDKVEAQVRSQIDNPDSYKHCATKLIGALGLHGKEALEAAGAGEFFNTFEEVLQALHCPEDIDQGLLAKAVANKLSAMAVQASALRHNVRHPHPDAPLSVDMTDIERLIKTQKEKLTEGQLKVARDIGSLLRSPRPMNALLSGDVGTGKTIPFLIAAVAAHQAGAKVTIIAPTSILADQIAKQLVSRFGNEISGAERITAGGKIENHKSILIGTPGITNVATKAKYIPNLLICDEQHKLPTAVREKLVRPWTHTLEVSATPIPRSLASALFGGKTILNLRECPVQKTFNCYVGDVVMRPKFSGMIKHALDTGGRAAVVYPRVNASVSYTANEAGEMVKREMESVLSGAAALEKAFPGKVVAIHGSMKDEEIALAIEAVRDGSKPLVVASTVIETGVDIPGITCMIVRDADYFGISQLHQLRGRLVRHGGEGYFGMLVNSMPALSEDTYARLDAIRTKTDGYELAEIDLMQRGVGELSGESQSGTSNETVFRLVKLRPEDFLRAKLSKSSLHNLTVDLSAQRLQEQDDAAELAKLREQPRLFA